MKTMLPMIFMPIMFGIDLDFEPGMVYAYYEDSFPRGCNNYPCFYKVSFLTKEETEIVTSKIKEIQTKIKMIEEKEKYGVHNPTKTTEVAEFLISKRYKVEDHSWKNDEVDKLCINEKYCLFMPSKDLPLYQLHPYTDNFFEEIDYAKVESFKNIKDIVNKIK